MSELPWLVARARATPLAPALFLPDRALTYAALEAEARALETSFARQGVLPGDVVATQLAAAEFACVVHALWLRGAVALPLNARLSAVEAAFQLTDSGARWLVHDRAAASVPADVLLAKAPALRILALERDRSAIVGGTARLEPGRAAAILYTSGTTGRPKGAILTAENFRASALAAQQHHGSRESDRCLACMPLFHVGGLSMLVRSVLVGSSVRVQEGFDPEAVVKALENDGITDVSFVANMLARVLELRGQARAPGSLRSVLLGGGPVPDPLVRRAQALGYPIAITYGLTEATSQVATRTPDDSDAVGARPLPGVEVRIDSADGVEGEVLVRGATVMRGYCNRPEETARVLRNGWLHTGDVGRLNDDGSLSILDRRSDLIISGGENIYPAEIESVLAAHPRIAEVGVGRREDARFGQRPVAWYVSTNGDPIGDAELAAFCRARLAAFKVPSDFVARHELPLGPTGKVVRSALVFGS